MKAYGGSITTAELLAGTVNRTVESGQYEDLYRQLARAWSLLETDPFPWTSETVRTTIETMREYDQGWQRVPVGETMEFHWPDSLVRPVPPPVRR
jgi:hypothetical protein